MSPTLNGHQILDEGHPQILEGWPSQEFFPPADSVGEQLIILQNASGGTLFCVQ